MFQTKVIEKIKIHIIYSIIFFRKRVFYEIMWKKCGTIRQATDENKLRRTRIACWITKARNTHSECIILTAFPMKQWSRQRPSMILHTFVHCLPCYWP